MRFGGEIPDFEPKKYVRPRKSLKVMCREIQLGFAAAALSYESAGLDKDAVAPDRLGVVFGAEMMYTDLSELEDAYRKCLDNEHFDFTRWGAAADGRNESPVDAQVPAPTCRRAMSASITTLAAQTTRSR